VRAEESGGEGAGEELPAIAAEIPVRIGEVSVSAAEPGAAGEPPQSSVDAPAAVETLSVSVAEPEAVALPVASPQGEVDLTAPVGDLAIKAAEVENDTLYVAGEAAPGTSLRVFANEELVGRVEANDEGAWLLEAQKDVPVGEVVIRADAVAEDSAIPTAQIETPFMRLAEGVSLAPSVVAAGGGEAPAVATGWAPQPSFVIIRRGDNLWRISRRNYGRGIRYKSIFAANRDRIRNPNLIYPGQVFIVPTRDHGWKRDPS
jgi:nucleoid-associated protein YgaU